MRFPLATYRLQLSNDFTLRHAREVVPYLAGIGISDLYLSPIFEARPNSPHGYDVTDPTRVRASLGGERALNQLAATARAHGLGILLDIVPNHMAAARENPWWMDVLRRGRASPHAPCFDIYWDSTGRFLLPILGDEIDALIERNEIALDAAAREIVYHEHRLPLAAGTLEAVPSLRDLLDRQHYQVVHWRTTSQRVGYRRFFDVSHLVGVRVEDPAVFATTHSLIQRLAAEGAITGLRIDHIDGLRDPADYLARLRAEVRGPDGEPVFTVVEKILSGNEQLPGDWQCEGTTGYEFLSLTSALLVVPDGYARIEAMYRRLTADDQDFHARARDKKLLVMHRLFGGELARLAHDLASLTSSSQPECAAAIREVTADLRVYRTYIRNTTVSAADRALIEAAIQEAVERDPSLRRALANLHEVLLIRLRDQQAAFDWVLRWQQFTGPVMAKGVEDTALYCHNVLLTVNEVGVDPGRPCLSTAELHDALRARRERYSHSLSATATHDTKRGEDTRARIAVLSEVTDEWRSALRRWMREGDAWKADLAEEDDRVVADADVDSMLYQTLLGAWPLQRADPRFTERIQQFVTKAVREAKEHTSWRQPDEDYEQALTSFVAGLMSRAQRSGLPDEIASFAGRIAPAGALNSLAQLLLKATAPGIPDVYQGTELWSFTLVDPDNRAAVDFAERRRKFEDVAPLVDAPDPQRVRALLAEWQDGRIKLFLTAASLRCRARHRVAFERGEIVPLRVAGEQADHVFAYAVRHDAEVMITAVTRWSMPLSRGDISIEAARWGDTRLELPAGENVTWRNALTGELVSATHVSVAELFANLPFALLEPRRDSR